jgi:hypothetical protein
MAFTTAKMGLRVWNLLTDLYDHTQIADNWAKVDYHDHSAGKGVQIPTEGIADAAITSVKLAANSDPTGAYTAAKFVHRAGGFLSPTQVAGTYVLRPDGAGLALLPQLAGMSVFYFDPNDWVATARSLHLVIRFAVITNAVAPTTSYTCALFPIASWGGAAGSAATIVTLGAAVTNSTTAAIVAPSAGGPSVVNTVEFDAPAAGWYTLATVQTGTVVASALVNCLASLQAKSV